MLPIVSEEDISLLLRLGSKVRLSSNQWKALGSLPFVVFHTPV
jgi:hypothetical protein